MRLLVRHVHRAFPELDRFEEDSCRRFVAAAVRGRLARVVRWLVVFVVWLLVTSAALGAALWIRSACSIAGKDWELYYLAVAAVLALCVSFLAALVARDILLRRRIAIVIRRRARCARCSYLLLGLPVDDSSHVTCSECGLPLQVDPALGELIAGPDDSSRFAAADGAPPVWRPKWLTRRFVLRFCAATLLLATLAAAVIGSLAWHAYRVRLRESAAAMATRPTTSDLEAALHRAVPGDAPPDSRNTWVVIQRAKSEYDLLSTALQGQICKPGERLMPDFTSLYRPAPSPPSDDATAKARAAGEQTQIEEAKAFLLKADHDRLCAELDSLAACVPTSRPVSGSLGPAMLGPMLPEMGDMRKFIRFNGARIDRACVRADADDLRNVVASSAALARAADTAPFLIERLVGIALDEYLTTHLITLVMEGLAPPLIDAIDGALRSHPMSRSMSCTIDTERLILFDGICTCFADPTLGGRQTFAAFLNSDHPGLKTRLGSFEENTAVLESIIASAHARDQLFACERGPLPTTDLALLGGIAQLFDKTRKSLDQAVTDRDGLLVMLALERFRVATGAYPERLPELTPTYLPSVPIDTWSGAPLLYRRIDSGTDAYHRPYLVYSVGADGQDNGGTILKTRSHTTPFKPPGVPGNDYIINVPGFQPLVPPSQDSPP